MKFWQMLVSNLIVGVITGLFILGFTRAGQKVDKNDEVIKSKADIVYVDSRDLEIKKEVDKKIDKETFAAFLESWKSTQADVRDIKNCLLNKK